MSSSGISGGDPSNGTLQRFWVSSTPSFIWSRVRLWEGAKDVAALSRCGECEKRREGVRRREGMGKPPTPFEES